MPSRKEFCHANAAALWEPPAGPAARLLPRNAAVKGSQAKQENLSPAEPPAAPSHRRPSGHDHTGPGSERGGRLGWSATHWRASSCAITTASGGQLGSGEAGSSPAPSGSPTTERSTHCGTTCAINRSAAPSAMHHQSVGGVALWALSMGTRSLCSLQLRCTPDCSLSECAGRPKQLGP